MYIKEVGCHLVAERLTSGQPSIDKGRLDKVSIDKGRVEQDTPFSFYGEYKNIRLTDEEYRKLKDKLQGHTDMMIICSKRMYPVPMLWAAILSDYRD